MDGNNFHWRHCVAEPECPLTEIMVSRDTGAGIELLTAAVDGSLLVDWVSQTQVK